MKRRNVAIWRQEFIPGMMGWLLGMILVSTVSAQSPPFFGAGGVGFDPEVSVISSGALLNATATVSGDGKYVTIGGGATNSRLQSLQTFPVTSPMGFVGGIALPSGSAIRSIASGSGNANTGGKPPEAAQQASPDAVARSAKSWVFTRQGMFLIAPLK